jgi:Tfp pilus assembly protein PilN
MIQFNLLPEVKLQFIKARRTKRMMELISVIVIAASLVVLALMFTSVHVVQKKSMDDLNTDIKKYSSQLKSTPDLDKILTVQNQLGTLDDLHSQKAVASRLFSYLSTLTPARASISKLNIDFTQNTLSLTGEAPSLDVINVFTDTLKTTTYTTADTAKDGSPLHAFSDVVLTTFGRDSKGATYSINASFDPVIFSDASEVKLSLPAGATVDPSALFQREAGGN